MRAPIPAIPVQVLLALGVSCAETPAPTLTEFARAHAAHFEVVGTWEDFSSRAILIESAGGGELRVTLVRGSAGSNLGEVVQGRLRESVIDLHPPLEGIEALYLCRIEGKDVLLLEPGTVVEAGDPPRVRGQVFLKVLTRRLLPERLDPPLYLPGPEDENRPAPWREVHGGG